MTALHATQLLCALLFASLSGFALLRWRAPLGRSLAAGSALTATWAGAAVAEVWLAWPGGQEVTFLETVRCGMWVVAVAVIYASGLEASANQRRVRWVAAAIGLAVLALGAASAFSEDLPDSVSGRLGFTLLLYGHLGLVTGGLMFVEAIVYRSSPEALWRLKFVWLAIASVLVFDFIRLTEALIYGRFSPDLRDGQAAVFALTAPLIGFTLWRHRDGSVEFTSGRRVIVQSAALLSVGLLLVSVSLATAFLSATSGPESQMMRTTALTALLLAAAVLAVSGRSRSFVRSRMRRVLLAPRYDYRREWPRFTYNLSSLARGSTLRERAQRAVADLVDSPQSSLWMRGNGDFEQVTRVGRPLVTEHLSADLAFFREFEASGWPLIVLDDPEGPRNALRSTPDLFTGPSAAWLLVPLVHHEQLIGFMVLDPPRIPRRITPEDEDLLRTVSAQVASYLAEEQATRALEEGHRFRELSQSASFFVHDLRNLANDLSLLLANARRHIDNPEFHPDLVASMDDTVAGMQRLLARIAAPGDESGNPQAPQLVDIAELVRRFGATRPLEGPELAVEVSTDGPCLVAADPDQLQAIMGHLIRNALDAVDPVGRVEVKLSTRNKNAVLEIADNGPGMPPDFLHERLHHPFQSSKSTGMGLGLYECREVARSLGGSLRVESEVGGGTTALVSLPIANA